MAALYRATATENISHLLDLLASLASTREGSCLKDVALLITVLLGQQSISECLVKALVTGDTI